MKAEYWQIVEWVEAIPFIQRKLLGIRKYTTRRKKEAKP